MTGLATNDNQSKLRNTRSRRKAQTVIVRNQDGRQLKTVVLTNRILFQCRNFSISPVLKCEPYFVTVSLSTPLHSKKQTRTATKNSLAQRQKQHYSVLQAIFSAWIMS